MSNITIVVVGILIFSKLPVLIHFCQEQPLGKSQFSITNIQNITTTFHFAQDRHIILTSFAILIIISLIASKTSTGFFEDFSNIKERVGNFMELHALKEELQGFFTDGLLTIIGCGLSCAEGVPGMKALGAHLNEMIPRKLAVEMQAEWEAISDLISKGILCASYQ